MNRKNPNKYILIKGEIHFYSWLIFFVQVKKSGMSEQLSQEERKRQEVGFVFYFLQQIHFECS